MNSLIRVFTILISLFFASILLAQDEQLQQAEAYFEKRFAEIVDGKASPDNINKAIEHYKKSNQEPEKYIGLLKSYEFKGSWTPLRPEQQKELYKKGIHLGEEKIKVYPQSAGIIYWYLANLGRWGNSIDIATAAEKGILNDIRDLSLKVIKLDPGYHQAGAMRLLGAIHLQAPPIPFVLPWPSKKTALDLLKRAYTIAPQNAANAYFYSKALIETDQESSARAILNRLAKKEPRPEFLLPDLKYIKKGQALLKSTF